MGFFDAFYFMSYTASTIGFGELPYPFTHAQRLWVTISIYLTVIGWAYAIGSLLALLQDRAFRQALALQHFTRKVARLREPFLLIVGYGRTGELLGRSFDALGPAVRGDRRRRATASTPSTWTPTTPTCPGWSPTRATPATSGVAGLGHPYCEAVLALTNDDEANLAVTMAAALLRPELPVIARTVSPAIARAHAARSAPRPWSNPFDRFGDHLRLALRAPASYQLLTWLESGPGAPLPAGAAAAGGALGGVRLRPVRPRADRRPARRGPRRDGRRAGRRRGRDRRRDRSSGTASEPGGAGAGRPGRDAVGFVAGTDNDTTNLSLVAAARRVNPDLFVAARQNQPASAPLFAAMEVDALLVPTEVVAHEVYAQLSTPLLWRFLQEMPARRATTGPTASSTG